MIQYRFQFERIRNSTPIVTLHRKTVLTFGLLAVCGAAGGMVADVFSLWIPEPDLFSSSGLTPEMRLMNILSQKSSEDLLLGSILGIIALPLHMFGFYLISSALRPANRTTALLFFIISSMMATIGAGFHGSIALVGETARAGDVDLFSTQMTLFVPWWWMLTGGFFLVSFLLVLFMRTPSTLFPGWCLFISPLAQSLAGSLLLWGLVQAKVSSGIVWLLMICGINLPLFIFHLVTLTVLLRCNRAIEHSSPSSETSSPTQPT